MAATAELLMRIRADTGQASSALRTLANSIKELEKVGTAAKTASGGRGGVLGGLFGGIGSNVASLKKNLGQGLTQGVGLAIGNSAMNLMGDAMGGLGDAAVGLNSRLEQSQIAFTVMLHSSSAAKDMLGELQQFAAETPFEFPDLVRASQRMLAMGFSARQILPMMTSIGDVAAASPMGMTGALDHITLALGQIQAKGRVQGDEMLQLTEAGVPAWKWLAATLNTDVTGAMARVTKGTVSADTMMKAFSAGSARDFGGMMVKQSNTFAGAMSTIHDNVTLAISTAFNPLFQVLAKITVAIANFTTTGAFKSWAGVVGVAVGGVAAVLGVTFVGAVVAATIATARWAAVTLASAARGAGAMIVATAQAALGFARLAAAALASAAATMFAWIIAAGPIVAVIAAIAIAAGAVALVMSGKFAEAKDALGKAIDDLTAAAATGMTMMQNGLTTGGADAGQGIATGLTTATPDVVDAATKAAKAANDAVQAELKQFNAAADQRKSAFDIAHVDAETNSLQLKLDANIAEHETLDLKRQLEDLDRNAVDYTQKRLELDQQDAITKARIGASSLKNNADDLNYQQQLLMAQVKAAKARGEHVDMGSVRAQMKAMKKQELMDAPALLAAEHGVSLAQRAKDASDLTGALKATNLERQKLALEQQLAPLVLAALLAQRANEDADYLLGLDKQRFAIEEQQYAMQKLILEARTKEAELQLWMIEHPVGGTTTPASAMAASTSLQDLKDKNDRTAQPLTPMSPLPDASTWNYAKPPVTSTVGEVHINVQGGVTSEDTIQKIKDSIGNWFQQAVDQVKTNYSTPASPALGGGIYGI